MMSKKSPILLLAAVIAAFLVSCGSMKNTATVHRTSKGSGSHDSRSFEMPKSLPPQSHALLAEAKKWIGTPYKYGGEDRRGVDCSGLVLNVYRSALDIKLPRSSREQASYCSPLSKDKLMPGDLLFFATSGSKKNVSHVGIYVGDGKMIHSSTSKGVIVSSISDDYYRRTYAGAGSVDKYRAMLGPVSTKAAKVKEESKEEELPFKMTPVTSLPVKAGTGADASADRQPAPASPKTATASAAKAKTESPAQKKPAKAAKTITTVGSSGSNQTKSAEEPDSEEARKAVLNSLIEQKLDSIFNR